MIRGMAIRRKYSSYTMIPRMAFLGNLLLAHRFSAVPGCVVECGVWRGGMTAAMAEVLGSHRHYYLFDSFEGLPEAKEIDGPAAKAWQKNNQSTNYFDNCTAEIGFAEAAMAKSPAVDVTIRKGWFSDTLKHFAPEESIAILRLDADWYDSTMECLTYLYRYVATGGVVIIDDYYTWDGCSKAVHDFLSCNKVVDRIRQNELGVCYIVKS